MFQMKTSLKKFAMFSLTLPIMLFSFGQFGADSISSILSQQQTISARINENRSTILATQARVDELNQKIESNQIAVSELARQVQITNPTHRMLTMMLSSSSLSKFIGQAMAENIMAASMNKQLKLLKDEKDKKDQALTLLSTTQVKLDQQSEEIKSSLAKATPPTSFTPKTSVAPLGLSEEQARADIVSRESSGNYQARNGQYYGAYQLDIKYLNGDVSPANQDATANSYVQGRYGSWTNAWSFWMAHGWY